jgi:hypothetical protein
MKLFADELRFKELYHPQKYETYFTALPFYQKTFIQAQIVHTNWIEQAYEAYTDRKLRVI